jgi:hypothetical protein
MTSSTCNICTKTSIEIAPVIGEVVSKGSDRSRLAVTRHTGHHNTEKNGGD